MRILNIHNVASHYRAPLFRILAKRHEQKVIFFQGKKAWREQRNPLDTSGYQAEVFHGPHAWRLLNLAFRLFFEDYDVLLMTFNGKVEPLLALTAAKLRGKPCVLWHELWDTPHTFLWQLASPFLGFFFRQWDAVLTGGLHTRKILIALGVSPDIIFLAPQTVDNALFGRKISSAQRHRIRTTWKLGRAKACLFVGRLVPEKGVEYIQDAVRRLPGRWKWIAVGEGPLKGLPDLSMGHMDPEMLPAIYASADCMLLPSLSTRNFREPWGLVVNEAMNQRLPVLASDAVGAVGGRLAEHNQSALVVPERDSAALEAALNRLDHEPGLARRLGREAQRRVSGFTFTHMVDQFDKAFAVVRGEKREAPKLSRGFTISVDVAEKEDLQMGRLLHDLGLGATFYINGVPLSSNKDLRRLATWKFEIAQGQSDGASTAGLGEAELRRELFLARQQLGERVGTEIRGISGGVALTQKFVIVCLQEGYDYIRSAAVAKAELFQRARLHTTLSWDWEDEARSAIRLQEALATERPVHLCVPFGRRSGLGHWKTLESSLKSMASLDVDCMGNAALMDLLQKTPKLSALAR